jgi:hypothetical protein
MEVDMNFSDALAMLKVGQKICRFGWNGKGMWLVLVNKWTVDITLAQLVAGLLPIQFIAMKTADDCFVPWLASQTDILAEDWMVIE